ncbi:MAG: hypothetical protein J2P21_18555 [Chloracidobacterium sp.]|nr:hypothetical protein [Chloracidobacterium sp.]
MKRSELNTNPKAQMIMRESYRPTGPEQRVNEPGVNLQLQPESFGATVAPEAIFEVS